MFYCFILFAAFAFGSAVNPKDILEYDPYDQLPMHDWLWTFQRAAPSSTPTAATVKGFIRETLQKAETEGIKGADLEKAAKKVSTDSETILALEKPDLDLAKIKSDLDTVKPDIMSLGSLNADLALWDGLAYLLEHVTVPDNIHITLAAVKMVSDNIAAEIPSPDEIVKYIHVPYHRPPSSN